MRTIGTALFTAALLLPLSATAQQPRDRVTFGGDAIVRQGEVVSDLVTMGGDAVVEGEVLGDVVTMGGDLTVMPTGRVHGETVTMGGAISVEPGASTGGSPAGLDGGLRIGPEFVTPSVPDPIRSLGHWIGDLVSSLLSYALLFLLGLVLMGVARERLDALQVVIIRRPFRAFGHGLLGFVGAIVAIVILCITIIGIPAAIVLGVVLPIALYIGMAAAATVLGAALPLPQLKERPVMQLAAGVATLFVASLVPVVGSVAIAIAALVGLGALVITRFSKTASIDLEEPTPAGPYRTQAA